ncbi:hypothetical protein QJS10_CPA02g00787 [Acorus calamus]|uniref:Uncharacterized protein n=1 Tax=Acorus calamus TaxID=4465 RepID=A0AAV9FDF4_ACOCL|nr:hypothetical protein QJS10_CPA02g00787 [Acorus calamus]
MGGQPIPVDHCTTGLTETCPEFRPYGSGGPYQVPSKPNVVDTAMTQFGMGGAYPPPHQSPPQLSSSSVAAVGEKQQQLHAFWAKQYVMIEVTTDFKNYILPPTRINKIV